MKRITKKEEAHYDGDDDGCRLEHRNIEGTFQADRPVVNTVAQALREKSLKMHKAKRRKNIRHYKS